MHNTTVGNPSRRTFLLRSEMESPRIAVTDLCLAMNATHCELCRNVCEADALRFAPRLGAMSIPVFDTDRCTQCGECVRVCPAHAIRMKPIAAAHG